MLKNCIICDSQFEDTTQLKLTKLVPKVCSSKCFMSFLKTFGIGSMENIIDITKNNGIAIQVIKDKQAFRSKIERKVSEFFDALGIKWEYEKYIFYSGIFISYPNQPIRTRCYIPDFFLPEYNVFVEVKEKEVKNNKALKFSMLLPLIVIDSNFLRRVKYGQDTKGD